jgi:hypothetical protein
MIIVLSDGIKGLGKKDTCHPRFFRGPAEDFNVVFLPELKVKGIRINYHWPNFSLS